MFPFRKLSSKILIFEFLASQVILAFRGWFWPTWAVCSVHTGRLCVSISTHRTSVCVCVCPSTHTERPWLSISTHISTLVLGLSNAGPSRGLFGWFWPTWAVCSVHTGRPWVSVSTHRVSVCVRQHRQDVRGCLCVSVSTHMTSVAVHHHTYQHARPSHGLFVYWFWTTDAPCQYTYQHAGPFRELLVYWSGHELEFWWTGLSQSDWCLPEF